MLTRIDTIKDVKTFAAQIIREGVNFHPDEDFNEYINIDSGQKTYSRHDADVRNQLMDQCFKICADNEEDIYELMQKVVLKEVASV